MNEQNADGKSKEIPLTPRDLKVLGALETWGVLGLGQLHGIVSGKGVSAAEKTRLFFDETDRRDYWRWFSKRLTVLAQDAYIKAHFFINHPKIFTLAEKGHEILKRRGLARMQGYRDSIEESMVDHEMKVSAAGLVMSQLLGLTVRTERERFQWMGRGGRGPSPERGISDLWIVDNLQPKAIEVEMHQKSEKRYEEIFEAYRRRMPDGGAVLYLTAWPSGVRCILTHAQTFRAPFIYACSLADFRGSAGRAPFESATVEDGPIILAPRGAREALAAR
ncbi:MAG: hypothetical protein Q8T11_18000 [Elusimicrobiota bacterium]|nr:hypothetical protein [Elusimicrobiota bacterium]